VYNPEALTVIVGVLLPLTIPGPDQTTEVFVLTGVTIAFAVVVLHVRDVEEVEDILIVFTFELEQKILCLCIHWMYLLLCNYKFLQRSH
jgi:hypothetical protein